MASQCTSRIEYFSNITANTFIDAFPRNYCYDSFVMLILFSILLSNCIPKHTFILFLMNLFSWSILLCAFNSAFFILSFGHSFLFYNSYFVSLNFDNNVVFFFFWNIKILCNNNNKKPLLLIKNDQLMVQHVRQKCKHNWKRIRKHPKVIHMAETCHQLQNDDRYITVLLIKK